MSTNTLIRILILTAAISFYAAGQTSGAQPEVENIRRLIAEYVKAVDTAGLAIVKRIWSNSPDVSFIHPLGHERGFDQVSQNVFRKLMGETFSERKLSIKDVSIHIYGDTAWAEFYWEFAAKFRKDGSPLTTKGRETQIYRKEQGQWRLVHVHYSGMPATGEPGNPLSDDARQAYNAVRDNILRSAEKMPAEKYNFRPAPRVRTFGQILGHIAQEQYLYFCGPVKGEQKAADIEGTKTEKSDLIAALKDSFAYCDSAYDAMTDAAAQEIVSSGGKRVMKLRLLWMNVVHDESHYGNIVTCLRINGLVPPSTEGQ